MKPPELGPNAVIPPGITVSIADYVKGLVLVRHCLVFSRSCPCATSANTPTAISG